MNSQQKERCNIDERQFAAVAARPATMTKNKKNNIRLKKRERSANRLNWDNRHLVIQLSDAESLYNGRQVDNGTTQELSFRDYKIVYPSDQTCELLNKYYIKRQWRSVLEFAMPPPSLMAMLDRSGFVNLTENDSTRDKAANFVLSLTLVSEHRTRRNFIICFRIWIWFLNIH